MENGFELPDKIFTVNVFICPFGFLQSGKCHIKWYVAMPCVCPLIELAILKVFKPSISTQWCIYLSQSKLVVQESIAPNLCVDKILFILPNDGQRLKQKGQSSKKKRLLREAIYIRQPPIARTHPFSSDLILHIFIFIGQDGRVEMNDGFEIQLCFERKCIHSFGCQPQARTTA